MPGDYDLRCEWGLAGVRALVPMSDAVIIVDVLSFSTAVDIAVANGAAVLPYPWQASDTEAFAAAKGALLASPRTGRRPYSLSPVSLQSLPANAALVLPSPNGGTLSLAAGDTVTFTACLRNCKAVATRARECGSRIAVIPAGEQWEDGSMRPCLEDLLGAGAVLAHLPGLRSPEAEWAVAAFERFRHDLPGALAGCVSGLELSARGFSGDIELAASYDVSSAIPILRGDRFVSDAVRRHPACPW